MVTVVGTLIAVPEADRVTVVAAARAAVNVTVPVAVAPEMTGKQSIVRYA